MHAIVPALFLFTLRRAILRHDIHRPENRWQTDEQRHVGDIVDQRVGHHIRALAAGLAEDEGEDKIAHARAIWHHQRAEHRALKTARAHGLQPPDHQERRRQEQRHKQPRRKDTLGFNPMNERI